MVITRYSQLVQAYHDLGPGDLYIGHIPASHLRSVIWTDLTVRGVRLLPSVSAQMVSAAKTTQAFILKQWMLPQTVVIERRKDLLDAVGAYAREGISSAITKQDHLHCGHGVRRWNDLETMYNCMSMADDRYPFVLQPFALVTDDVRVIVVGNYTEAYARYNPDGFRKNLAAGGGSRPYSLSVPQTALCMKAMARVDMPYAHIDLIVTEGGDTYLSELNLNGGTAGARIPRDELEQLKKERLATLADAFGDESRKSGHKRDNGGK